jgi:hypothetical protein
MTSRLLRRWRPPQVRSGEARFARPAIAGAAVSDPAHERAVESPEGDSGRDVRFAYAPSRRS